MPDETTQTLRRLVAQRSQVVQQMTRIKNRIHGVLHTVVGHPKDLGGAERARGRGEQEVLRHGDPPTNDKTSAFLRPCCTNRSMEAPPAWLQTFLDRLAADDLSGQLRWHVVQAGANRTMPAFVLPDPVEA